jgi:hypothetical protein
MSVQLRIWNSYCNYKQWASLLAHCSEDFLT